MPEIVVRPMRPEDTQAWDLLSVVYNDGRALEERAKAWPWYERFVAEVDGRIAGYYSVLSFEVSRGDARLRAGGVAAVAVDPAYRNGGVGGAMMRWSLRDMRERGTDVAALYGFRESYYRTFGYEVAGKRLKIRCEHGALPRLKPDLPVREVPRDRLEELGEVILAFGRMRSGVHLRSDQWGRLFRYHEDRRVYAFGESAEAYMVVDHKVDFWSEQAIPEFLWATERGYRNGLSFIAGLGANKSSMVWHEPSDSPFLAQHLDHGVTAEVIQPTMWRVLDVPRCLEKLKPTGRGKLSIRVRDPLIAENDASWRIEFGSGRVSVVPSEDAAMSIDVRHFGQALLGDPGPAAMVAMGLLEVKDGSEVESLAALLPPLPVYLQEFF
jgi:predicted acetyltransferase